MEQKAYIFSFEYSYSQIEFEGEYLKTLIVYWWLAYDVIKNMIMQIMLNLLQTLVWPTRKRVFVPDLMLFGLTKTEL